MTIEVRGVSKRFVARGRILLALDAVSLTVETGSFVALVGPSGCGKSTLLNMVAGIASPSSGEILHDGQPVTGINRRVGYMTQQDGLLPWRTVGGNVALPLELAAVRRSEVRSRVHALLRTVGLDGFADHFPVELSGGMRKRAALAQLLIYEPGTLLLDEPFGAVDAQLKLVLQAELMRIWEETGKTILFVTHDLSEAISLAQRVVVFTGRPGRIKLVTDVELPRPRDLFRSRFSPQFLATHERLWAALAPEIAMGEAL